MLGFSLPWRLRVPVFLCQVKSFCRLQVIWYLVGHFGFWQATIAATLGNLFGALVAYYVGVWGGRPFLKRYGRYFFINERELAWTERLFEHYGEATVFVGRMLPVVRTFISLPAGIARMNPLKMATYTVIGAFLWCAFLIYVGQKLGENWDSLKPYFHRADIVVGGVIVLVVIYVVWKRPQTLIVRSS